jgi:putative membrane protein
MPRGDTAIGGVAGDRSGGLIILAGGLVLWFLCARDPAALPAIAPWQFSWPAFLTAAFALLWFARGCRAVPVARWRRVMFAAGVVSVYAVLQTHFDYWAQHMFFLNRIQHFVMQDLGPFMIGLATPSEALRAGMPRRLRRMIEAPAIRRLAGPLQQPLLVVILFTGLLILWLIPSVQFRAMLDPSLYSVMNGSMVASGLLFWCLALDSRPRPAARLSRFTRLVLVTQVMFPMIITGTVIASANQDLYLNYDLCGRLFPLIGARADQQIGALIIWIPGGFLSGSAMLLLAKRMFEEDDRASALDVIKYRASYPGPDGGDVL